MRWDDLQLLRLVDDLEQAGNTAPLSNGLNLLQEMGGPGIAWDREAPAFAHELELARQGGYLTWKEQTDRFVNNPSPSNNQPYWLQQIWEIRVTLAGRDRARGRVIQRPLPDPDEDDDRLITGMTLEEVARSIADVYTGRQLPRYLEDSGVPERYLADVEGQAKWEYVLSVLERLHDGGSEARRVLCEFIGGWLDGRHHDPPGPEIRRRVTALLAQQGWHVRDGRLVIGERTYDAAGTLTPLGRDVRVAALHPEIRQVADRYIQGGRMEVAIFESFKAVVNRVKTMTGVEGDGGAGMLGQVLSDDNPRLVLGDLSTQTGKDIQRGMRFLFMGAATAIRNPDAHEQFKALQPEEGFEEVAFASMLMRRLDEAQVLRP
jgi:uncharacterized protein (TIGR02391 family)